MDVVPPDDHINGGVHLNASDLCPGKILFDVDVMDMVILNQGKYTSQMTYDPGLSAVVDLTVPMI